MHSPFLLILLAVISIALLVTWLRARALARAEYIRRYMFPPGLLERLAKKRPELSLKERQLVARGLRQFFLAYLKSGRKFVSMPSQLADDLWHEFILYTRHYEAFCNKAFGGYLHHTPAVVLGPNRQNNAGLRRTWRYACLEENINPLHPTRLPLLFALDGKFQISDGFLYAPDCTALRKDGSAAVHCGGDFSNSSFDGGTDGLGEGGSDSAGDSGGDGGGCGGGCGGGD